MLLFSLNLIFKGFDMTTREEVLDRFPYKNTPKSEKKVLYYVGEVNASHIFIGQRADLLLQDPHPNVGSKYILTSAVLDFDVLTGEIETLNTVYKPASL